MDGNSIDDKVESGTALLRILAFGEPKTKKTWWAGQAADAGFNVILLDADDGWHILKNLAPDSRKRIHLVDIVDTLHDAVAAKFATYFLKGRQFKWSPSAKQIVTPANAAKLPDAIEFNSSLLGADTVLIIDSWTAIAQSISLRFCIENNIDLADAAKTDWDGYRWAGALANWMLSQLNALGCHIIVIGHETLYEKKITKFINGKKESITEWSRTQIKSISGPHGQLIGSQFSDILYFTNKGSAFKIDTSKADGRLGGCRHVPPKVYRWEELQFATICNLAGIQVPPAAPGIQQTQPQEATTTKQTVPTTAPTIQIPKVTKTQLPFKLGG